MENGDRVTYFASTDNRGKRVPFGIKAKDRTRHMYVIGKTGMGKSTLLENMAIQDICNGEGLAFIDPHGSAVETLLSYIPEHRIKDVVYFAPFDLEHPIAFNVMEDVGYDKRHLVVSGLMATFKKIWVDAWSARMEYILSNTLLALLEYPGATLLGVNRMYVDKEYRKKVVENIKDPVVKDFWTKEFATYTDRYTQEATPAIQNKIGQFTSNPLIRNIIGQPKSSFDVRTLMDEKKILLINLSKGLVGDVNMKLLGSMLTTRIFLGAMSRANLDPVALKHAAPFYFYVDEFQNFANETFAEILSEARKYNLNLIMTHQYVEQMEEEVRAAVFGNVGTTVAFRVGPFDAEILETVFSPEFTKEDLVNLGFVQIYLTLMIDGVGSRPFSAVTIPPIEPPSRSFKQEVIEASRKTFAVPRAPVETAIYDDLASIPAPEPLPPRIDWKRGPRGNGGNGGGNGGGNNGNSQGAASGMRNGPKKPSMPFQKEAKPPAPVDRESLKAALALMTEKIAKANEKKNGEQKTSLKEAVAAAAPPLTSARKPEPPSQPSAPVLKENGSPKRGEGGVFEVPEEELRAVFKE
jgi:hypothetical protein